MIVTSNGTDFLRYIRALRKTITVRTAKTAGLGNHSEQWLGSGERFPKGEIYPRVRLGSDLVPLEVYWFLQSLRPHRKERQAKGLKLLIDVSIVEKK